MAGTAWGTAQCDASTWLLQDCTAPGAGQVACQAFSQEGCGEKGELWSSACSWTVSAVNDAVSLCLFCHNLKSEDKLNVD